MQFTSALITAAHANIKSGKSISWKEAINLAIKETKEGLIKTVTFLKKNGEEATRIVYTKITNFIGISGTGKSYSHTTKYVDLQKINKGAAYFIGSYITENLISIT